MTPEEHVYRITEANQRADLARFEADVQTSLEATKAGNQAASDALKAVTLLNGGAAVAMLAFIGHLASTQVDPMILDLLKRPLFDFVVATFLSVVATASTYFVQEGWIRALKYKFRKRELDQATPRDGEAIRKAERAETNSRRMAWTLKAIAILCGVLALVAFGVGSYAAFRAFEHLNNAQQHTIVGIPLGNPLLASL
jgi:hypothetical protein